MRPGVDRWALALAGEPRARVRGAGETQAGCVMRGVSAPALSVIVALEYVCVSG